MRQKRKSSFWFLAVLFGVGQKKCLLWIGFGVGLEINGFFCWKNCGKWRNCGKNAKESLFSRSIIRKVLGLEFFLNFQINWTNNLYFFYLFCNMLLKISNILNGNIMHDNTYPVIKFVRSIHTQNKLWS